MSHQRVCILTGLSGSGKSTAARALEDRGFFVVDNLPLVMLPSLLEVVKCSLQDVVGIAIVVDVRTRQFLVEYDSVLEQLRQARYKPEITFFDASDEVLLRRYSETRRNHPLAAGGSILSGIEMERELLQHVRTDASIVMDSSGLNPRQLGERVLDTLCEGLGGTTLIVRLESFGYRYGLPPDADLVFDVRFLPNPHYIDELRPLTGRVEKLRDYVLKQPHCQEFLQHLHRMLKFLLPLYRLEGKSYLTIAVGCTGGRHRSVSIVEALLQDFPDQDVTLQFSHRDIDKG
ncbi:MAG TPA: RNase adapter RapZ [Geopsychrobacteraceae bacterium]|nr:RNase adapter RapZ [Geopsychrobacteraceae bacterium]